MYVHPTVLRLSDAAPLNAGCIFPVRKMVRVLAHLFIVAVVSLTLALVALRGVTDLYPSWEHIIHTP